MNRAVEDSFYTHEYLVVAGIGIMIFNGTHPGSEPTCAGSGKCRIIYDLIGRIAVEISLGLLYVDSGQENTSSKSNSIL